MRLSSDNMSVPEINGAIANNNSLIKKQSSSVASEFDNIEGRNLRLASQLDAHKCELIKLLSRFPATALWLSNKAGQACDSGEQDEEPSPTAELDGLLKDIKASYQEALQSLQLSDNIEAGVIEKQRLMLTTQQFPFVFEDLLKLVDLIVYAFNNRGLSYKPSHISDDMRVKKQGGIIARRLAAAAQSGKTSSAAQFKAMVLDPALEKFLFLSEAEMDQLVPELLLAEHSWLEYRRQLATANAKLVLFIANQYKGSFLDFDDLVQEGHSGLLKAVDRFKYQLGFQFSTYAGYWIRQAISRALSRSERVVRIPCGQIATINKVYRAKDELIQKSGLEPSIQELAEHTDLGKDEINNLLAFSQTAVALESFEEDENEIGFAPIDFLEQNTYSHCFNKIAQSQLQNVVKTAVKALNAREAKILSSHFGIGTDEAMTLQEIGTELNLTRERVRQIQVVALNKIKMRYGEQLASFL